MNLANFDEASVNWQSLPGPDGEPADHIWMSIVNVDDDAKIVDVLFKFAANEKIVLHRHTANFNTFVVQGEHRIYTPDGDLKETRPVGTYKAGKPDAEPHSEGGGDEDVELQGLRDVAPPGLEIVVHLQELLRIDVELRQGATEAAAQGV